MLNNPLCVEKAEPAFHGRVYLTNASCVQFDRPLGHLLSGFRILG